MADYELSRLLENVASLKALYEQAKTEKNEAALREMLTGLESALARIERLSAPSR
jgi:hypothetical protein